MVNNIELPVITEGAMKRIYIAAAKAGGLDLGAIPVEHRTLELCSIAVRKSGNALQWIPEEFKPLLINDAIASCDPVLGLLSNHQSHLTEEMCLIAVTWNPLSLPHVPKHLRTYNVCLTAVRGHGRALNAVPKKLLDEQLCLTAIKERGYPLMFTPLDLRTPEMCLTAVKRMGSTIEHIPDNILTEEMCLIAVEDQPCYLEYVPKRFRTKTLVAKALDQEAWSLQHLPVEERTKDLCELAIESHGKKVRDSLNTASNQRPLHIPPWMWEEDLLLKLAQADGNAFGKALEEIERYRGSEKYQYQVSCNHN